VNAKIAVGIVEFQKNIGVGKLDLFSAVLRQLACGAAPVLNAIIGTK
jgi:hypothetical protein